MAADGDPAGPSALPRRSVQPHYDDHIRCAAFRAGDLVVRDLRGGSSAHPLWRVGDRSEGGGHVARLERWTTVESPVASGVYLVRLSAVGEPPSAIKMTLTK